MSPSEQMASKILSIKLKNIDITPSHHFSYLYLKNAQKLYPELAVSLKDIDLMNGDTEAENMKLFERVREKVNKEVEKPLLEAFQAKIEAELTCKLAFAPAIHLHEGRKWFEIGLPVITMKSTDAELAEKDKLKMTIFGILTKKFGISESAISCGFSEVLIDCEVAVSKLGIQVKPVRRDSEEILAFMTRHFGEDFALVKVAEGDYRLKSKTLERDAFVLKLNPLVKNIVTKEHYSRDASCIKVDPTLLQAIKSENLDYLSKMAKRDKDVVDAKPKVTPVLHSSAGAAVQNPRGIDARAHVVNGDRRALSTQSRERVVFS